MIFFYHNKRKIYTSWLITLGSSAEFFIRIAFSALCFVFIIVSSRFEVSFQRFSFLDKQANTEKKNIRIFLCMKFRRNLKSHWPLLDILLADGDSPFSFFTNLICDFFLADKLALGVVDADGVLSCSTRDEFFALASSTFIILLHSFEFTPLLVDSLMIEISFSFSLNCSNSPFLHRSLNMQLSCFISLVSISSRRPSM